MAVTNQKSAQLAAGYITRPTENHGKLRFAYFKHTQSGAGDATSTVDLCVLPSGAVRVLPGLSRISTSAFGVACTLDVGTRAYVTSVTDSTTNAEDTAAFRSALDVSSAVAGAALNTTIKYDLFSYAGVTVAAKVAGGAIPDGATIEGYIAYLYE